MHLQDGVLMANGIRNLAPNLWQKIRRLLEPESGAETAGLIGASIMPGVGEAIDIADIAAGIQDRDLGRIGLGAVGLALPFISGRTIRGVRDLARAGGTPPAITPPPPSVKGLEALDNSRLEKFFLDTQQGKATGSQWQAMLKKAPGGIPKGEMEWTGITKLLSDNPSRKFTRTELQKHMDDSGIKLKETWRGSKVNEFADWSDERQYAEVRELRRRMHRLDTTEHQGLRRLTPTEKSANHAQARKIEQRIKDINQGVSAARYGRPMPTTTEHHDYGRIKGSSENYRELTVQLDPDQQKKMDSLMKARKELGMGYDGTASMPPEIQVKYNALTEQINSSTPITRFTDSHWKEPNVLVHMRMTDRAGNINPKTGKPEKVLFIEEIQSDWHEKGRKQGYYNQKVDDAFEAKERSATQARDALENKHGISRAEAKRQQYKLASSRPLLSPILIAEKKRLDGILKEFNDADKKLHDLSFKRWEAREGKIVPGPFKDTDEWVGLGMRRAIQEGVDGGYDRIAWGTGEQVANAQGLRGRVSKIEYNPNLMRMEAWDMHGSLFARQHVDDVDELAEYIGKAPAERLMKVKPENRYVPNYEIKKHKPRDPTNEQARNMGPPPPADSRGQVDYSYRYSIYDPDEGGITATARSRDEAEEFIERQWAENYDIRTIEGDDLAVGGNDMIYFYDKMVPNAVKKEGKKLGGIKIERIGLGEGSPQSFAITPEMRNIAGRSGQRLWGTGGLVGLGLAARQQGNN
jgi:hypothetical protein